jgi:hypothetical protein
VLPGKAQFGCVHGNLTVEVKRKQNKCLLVTEGIWIFFKRKNRTFNQQMEEIIKV